MGKFGLNDKIMLDKQTTARAGARKGASNSSIILDDCTFDKCVRLGRFDSDRSISFVPPDGEFELMRYRVTENVELPFKITPSIHSHGRTRLEITVTVKANFEAKQSPTKWRFLFQFPRPHQNASSTRWLARPSTMQSKIPSFGVYPAIRDSNVSLSQYLSTWQPQWVTKCGLDHQSQ